MRLILKIVSTLIVSLTAFLLVIGFMNEIIKLEFPIQAFAEQTCLPPKADAGPDQSVIVGQTVQLDGSNSTEVSACTSTIGFIWSFTSKPADSQAALSDPGAAKPTFVADLAGEFKLQLMVNNSVGSDQDVVAIIASPEPRKINVPQDFASIQAAIDAANSGDMIIIDSGTFTENLVIEKNLFVIAKSSGTVIKGVEPGKPVLLIQSNQEIQVTISNISIANAQRFSADRECAVETESQPFFICPDGIEIRNLAHAKIEADVISGNDIGIVLYDSAQASIVNDNVMENALAGIDVENEAQATISGTAVEDNGIGIEAGTHSANRSQAQIVNSAVGHNKNQGIFIGQAAQVAIRTSLISENQGDGVFAYGHAQISILDSASRNNLGWGIAVELIKCGYSSDAFSGSVDLQGKNSIAGNQKGQVCLP